MVTVGATIGRPRAFNERPYKPKSAKILVSLPICIIMGCSLRGMGFARILCDTKEKLEINENGK